MRGGSLADPRQEFFVHGVHRAHQGWLVFLDEKATEATGPICFQLAGYRRAGQLGVDVFIPGRQSIGLQMRRPWPVARKAVWILHFEQKNNMKFVPAAMQTKTKTIEVPLKGRVW